MSLSQLHLGYWLEHGFLCFGALPVPLEDVCYIYDLHVVPRDWVMSQCVKGPAASGSRGNANEAQHEIAQNHARAHTAP